MRIENFFILIGRTFLSAFFLVNFFNIFPFNFSTNAWFVQVSMLFVDTASLLLLGLASFKLCAFFLLNKNADKNEDLSNAQINNIQLIDKFSKFGVYFFLFLALAQFFIFFNGIRQVNSLYMFQYDQIEQRFETKKEKISSTFKDNSQNTELKGLPTSLDSKKKMFIKDLNKANSKAKFLLVSGNLKIFLMSLVWTYGLYKLSCFRYGN